MGVARSLSGSLGRCLALVVAVTLPQPAQAACPGTNVATIDAGATVLVPGAEATCPNGSRYRVDVPAGATRLEVTLGGVGGNADLFMRVAAAVDPDAPQYLSAGPTSRETLAIDDPTPGLWFIEVVATSDFPPLPLRVEIAAAEEYLVPSRPPSGLADDGAGGHPPFRFFTLDVPLGTESLHVGTGGGSGDVDLFVRHLSLPTETSFTASSKSGGNEEGVDIPTPASGVWKVGLLRVAPYDGVDLTIDIDHGGACQRDLVTLCLLGGRFRLRVFWQDPASGAAGAASALPDTDRTGFFYFFSRSNTELSVKMLDGTAVNGRFWVFWGGLTSLPYTIEVFDTATGATRTYQHPADSLAGGADTAAFE